MNDPNAPAFTTDYEGKALLLGNFNNPAKSRNGVKMTISSTQTRVSLFKSKIKDKQDSDATPALVTD